MRRYETADDAVHQLASEIKLVGDEASPRGMTTRELTSVAFTIEDPRDRLVRCRPIREGYAAASVAWNLAQRDDVASICEWNEHGRKISDDGVKFHGANYGQRWNGYLLEAVELLKLDPDTRRAWVPIWKPGDLVRLNLDGCRTNYSRDGKDVPCTLGFGLRIRNSNVLDMQVIMRSQSVVGVMPYDVFLFTVLQELIANELGIHLGRYEHTMLSAHVYEREFAVVDDMVPPSDVNSPMAPLRRTLSEARNTYPLVFDLIGHGGAEAHFARNPPDEQDPIELMMWDNAPERSGL